MTEQQQDPSAESATPPCPRCGGAMWDNREGKRNPKAPDFKCKDRECDGVIWPPRGAAAASAAASAPGAGPGAAPAAGAPASASAPQPSATGGTPGGKDANGMPLCPICGGAMWDDRDSKRNPKAPDFKCRNKPRERGGPGCEGVIWPSRDGSPSPYPAGVPRRSAGPAAAAGVPPRDDTPFPSEPPPYDDAPPHDDDDLPF